MLSKQKKRSPNELVVFALLHASITGLQIRKFPLFSSIVVLYSQTKVCHFLNFFSSVRIFFERFLTSPSIFCYFATSSISGKPKESLFTFFGTMRQKIFIFCLNLVFRTDPAPHIRVLQFFLTAFFPRVPFNSFSPRSVSVQNDTFCGHRRLRGFGIMRFTRDIYRENFFEIKGFFFLKFSVFERLSLDQNRFLSLTSNL